MSELAPQPADAGVPLLLLLLLDDTPSLSPQNLLQVLLQARGIASLWRDLRGQLLLSVLVMVGCYFAVNSIAPDAQRWLLFNYLVLALCGLLLVLQPAPGREA